MLAVHRQKRRGLASLEHCERPPTRVSQAERGLASGSSLTTLGHCERPPTRAPLTPLARPESVDVHNAQVSSNLAALGYLVKQRLTLASLGSPKTPADSDLARSAREALVGGRFW
ncbi:hypothetical protein TYRP_020738 [Tyrophagus putrescentiae]|nr:hypothetical protein TYRP_020738 [Tyrophagus putrescentiae]